MEARHFSIDTSILKKPTEEIMNNWNPTPSLIPIPIDAKQYEENLAEIAECLYDYFRKLDPNIPIGLELPHQDLNKEVRHE
jgi:hypothetical protein